MEIPEAFWVEIIRKRLIERGISLHTVVEQGAISPDIIAKIGDRVIGIEVKTGRKSNAYVIPSGTVSQLNDEKIILEKENPDYEVETVLVTDLEIPSYFAELAAGEGYGIIEADEPEAAGDSLIQHILGNDVE